MDRRRFLVSGSLLALAGGCFWDKQTTRSQLSDSDPDAPKTLGDISFYDNAVGIAISGVGLVTGLEGTGGGAPPSEFRTMLENYLRGEKKIDNVKELLESPANAMVLVSGIIAAGARAGDPIDLEVTLPPGSKVKSLRGGYLLQCKLMDYDTRGNVQQFLAQNAGIKPSAGPDGLMLGHTLARGEGPLHAPLDLKARTEPAGVGLDDPNGDSKRAWVWAGGRCLRGADRPFYLVLNPDHQRYRVVTTAAERINETFHGPGAEGDKIAVARTKEVLALAVPAQYRLNLPHYMRVVRAIPLERPSETSEYFRRLEEQLQEPGTCLGAALRLEALGAMSIPALKAAKDSEYPLVAFAAAQALAYLGQPAAAEVLAHLTQEHPAFQAYCLTALAALDDGISYAKLEELINSAKPAVRYGAFRALRALDPHAPTARGEVVPPARRDEDGHVERPTNYFFLHQFPSEAPGLVHILSGKRAEVVLFGEAPRFVPECSLSSGEFTVTARQGDTTATVSRFSAARGHRVEQCSLAVADVVRALAKVGATYAEVACLLRQADSIQALSCALAADALPKALSVRELAVVGREDPRMQREADLLKSAEDELEATPTLFESGSARTARR
jgi:hypothetical protein